MTRNGQSGLTLVELMISITLGMLVVLAATALLVSSKSAYTGQDDSAKVRDTANYALELINRAARQGAYENWDTGEGGAPILTLPKMSANIAGLDASSLKDTTTAIDSPLTGATAVVNGSDVLGIRFFGSGPAGKPDNGMIDCAGFGISAPASQSTAEQDRGWSIFYVVKDTGGEPELRCKYYPDGGGTWASVAVARGVESFQVLYGLDTDGAKPGEGDRIPNQFVTATAINALDDKLSLDGADAAAQAIDKNKRTNWKRVVAIKVALLLRGTNKSRNDVLNQTYDLFGSDYSTGNAAADTGTLIKEAELPTATRNRYRKLFLADIQFRNQAEGSGK
ncbi:PilW family protein [Undibacterium arcticum]|uniref:PilW family protein n=1 Tax=Undibacterium arcticum TaxID=1762892 RepID=A0ABV7F3D5_9BURK